MASGNEAFSIEGPTHLTTVDWNNPHHRRTVAASLVKGVYKLERDRQEKREGPQALAPPWWKFFHFELIDQLVDDDDGSIFGAIFEYKPPPDAYYRTNDRSPCCVIAFRGTLFELDSFLGDLKSDFEILRNGLQRKIRFKTAMETVRDKVDAVGASNLLLTGHSLGAAMAMLAGKTMAKEDKFLEALLPFVSLLEIMEDGIMKDVLRFTGNVIKAGLACKAVVKGCQDSFAAISSWIPCLFVNQVDTICSGYIGYFENRKRLKDKGAGGIARLTSQHSLTNQFMHAVRIKGVETSEPLHLLPSANLTVNPSPPQGSMEAHRLKHWWRPNFEPGCTVYKYK